MSLTGLLALASLLLPLARWSGFPFTVLLALAGIVLALLATQASDIEGLGVLFEFLNALNELDITSDLVFFVFLPALIFSSALDIELRRIVADLRPILLLAVAGLLISTILSGGAIWLVASEGLLVCLLVGAIISATDPVAVVAIFKELGAPKRLTVLVEGESLLNDATAIVAFSILAAVIAGTREVGIFDAVWHFLLVFLGGAAVGLAVSIVAALIIGELREMPTAEITLTLCLAYFAFILSEHVLHVSGVIAVVMAGLVIGSYGRTRISPKTWPNLREIWEELEFWANSLIFFLVGLAVPGLLQEFSVADGLALAILIGAGFATRALVIFGLLPLFAYAGLMQTVNRAYQSVMVWGGLRGAVSLALALLILESDSFNSETKHFVGTLVTGFVIFTLFINAPVMRILIRLLKLDKLSPSDAVLKRRALQMAQNQTRQSLEQIARAYQIDEALEAEIRADHTASQAGILTEGKEPVDDESMDLSDDERLRIALITLTNLEHHLHLNQFRDYLVSPAITRVLLHRADSLSEEVKQAGIAGYRRVVEQNLGFGPAFRATLWVHRSFAIATPLAWQLAVRFDVLLATQTSLRELLRQYRRYLDGLLTEHDFEKVDDLLQWRLTEVNRSLHALELQYPDYLSALHRRHLQRILVKLEEASYEEMLDEEVISSEVFATLDDGLNKKRKILEKRPPLDIGLKTNELVRRVPYLAALGESQIAAVAALLKPRFVVPGERVVTKGEEGREMYFVSSGALEVATQPNPIRLGSGDFFGEIALVMSTNRVADVTALGFCRLLTLPAAEFRGFLDTYPELREIIARTARERQSENAAMAALDTD